MRVPVALIVLVSATVALSAQSAPSETPASKTATSFSGRWHLESIYLLGGIGTSGQPVLVNDLGGPVPICGEDVSLTVDAASITIERKPGSKNITATIPLNGTETMHQAVTCRPMTPAIERDLDLASTVAASRGESLPGMRTTARMDGTTIQLSSLLSSGAIQIERHQIVTLKDANILIVEKTGIRGGVAEESRRSVYRRQAASGQSK
jgi:hypothetical protein